MKSNDVNVRRVCLEALMSLVEDKRFLSEVINDTLGTYRYLEKNKRSYISRMLRGTVERLIEIDACISAYSSVKLGKLNQYIRNILRLAVYEIRYMDSIPYSATCDEYVKLAKRKASPKLGGFVNGILRSMLRSNFNKVTLKDNEVYSMPEWIYDKFEAEYNDAEAICKAFLEDSLITVRTNLYKTTPRELIEELKEEGVKVTAVEELDYAFAIENINYLAQLESFKKGLFYVQDISSMMVGHKCPVKPGSTVIDVCAAPGGKSLHVAERLSTCEAKAAGENRGHVYAFDISNAKVELIKENIERFGLNNITAMVGDARLRDTELLDKADVVIADLPCSGLGVIGRKPDIKLRINKEDVDSLAMLQQDILNICKDYVKKGGMLMYSTCTISRAENSDNVRKFLESNSDFELVEETQYMPTALQDGFYLALIKRHL